MNEAKIAPRAAEIDTPLHGYLPFAHVDHVHPDAIIALAASKGGESATREIWGMEACDSLPCVLTRAVARRSAHFGSRRRLPRPGQKSAAHARPAQCDDAANLLILGANPLDTKVGVSVA